MALKNLWWESDPRQCFWVEITSRENLGADLLSPKVGRGGKATPGYESMVHVNPGDVIFHYWQQPGQEPALVSYSIAVGQAETSVITWRPHGKNSTNMKPERSAAWRVPLGGMTDLAEPVNLSTFRDTSKKLHAISEQLKKTHGKSIYFPFAWYDGELRANQVYLTKFPAEIVDLFPELQILGDVPATTKKPRPKDREPRPRTSGYMADPILRKAIELQAMAQAAELLHDLGYETTDVSANNPYDLHAVGPDDELAVEVKGSSGTATTVELTIGEVNKAREKSTGAMLIVVDQIPFKREGNDVITELGRVRFWPGWDDELTDVRLQAIRFRYLLTPGKEDNRPEKSSLTMPTPSPWQSTYEQLIAERSSLNSTTKVKQNKQFYSNEGADLLLESVAKVLNMKSKPTGIEPKDWAKSNPSDVVVVDARNIIFHVNESLVNAPQSAVKGRLIAMLKYAPEVQFVGIFRKKYNRKNTQDVAAKFAVVLYRSDVPMLKPRKMYTDYEDDTD